jgi:hypothetical protein
LWLSLEILRKNNKNQRDTETFGAVSLPGWGQYPDKPQAVFPGI